MNNYSVYILTNTVHNKTYVGITNNMIRRIRQHNGELVGGAKYTTSNKSNGLWNYYGLINNLEKRLALSFEKKIKLESRKMKGTPIERRILSANYVLDNYNNQNQTNYFLDLIQ